MKKSLLFLSVLFSPSLALAWGALDRCVTPGPSSSASPTPCFIEPFVAKGPNVCVALQVKDWQKRQGSEAVAIQRDVAGKVSRALNTWTSVMRKAIVASKRENEFADFLAVWPTNVTVKLASERDTAGCIPLILEVGRSSGGTCGEAYPWKNFIAWRSYKYHGGKGYVTMDQCEAYETQVLQHELGHLLGLADLYSGKLEREGAESAVARDFSLLPMGISGREMEHNSLMTMATGHPIGCDDLDGIVNVVDLLLAKQGKKSPRWTDGWTSFCSHYTSFRYAYGQPVRSKQDIQNAASRLGALSYFNKQYLAWYEEAGRINKAANELEEELKSYPRPLTTEGLMLSAKLEYLNKRYLKAANVYDQIGTSVPGKGILQRYADLKALVDENADIAPGAPLFNAEELAKTSPRQSDLMDLNDYRSFKCIKCGQDIPAGKDFVFMTGGHTLHVHQTCLNAAGQLAVKPSAIKAYVDKYGYDKKQTIPSITYGQLMQRQVTGSLTAQSLPKPVATRPAPRAKR